MSNFNSTLAENVKTVLIVAALYGAIIAITVLAW